MNITAAAELNGSPESARAARDLVRDALGDQHPATADAQLVVSELVSNAIAHSRSGQPGGTLTVAVDVSAEPPGVLICVSDAGADDKPALTQPGPDREHGRGLSIVAALATEWGTETRESGRSTWCRIATKPARNVVSPRPRVSRTSTERQAPTRPKPAPKEDARGPRTVDGYVINYGGPPTWSCVVQVNEALRGRTQPNGVPIADMWPDALHRSWDSMAQREAHDREAEP